MTEVRVCPFCGAAPGAGVFCAACGRNLSAVERLPTRAEWEAAGGAEAASGAGLPGEASGAGPPGEASAPGEAGAAETAGRPLADRCADATAAFLAAMHAAGDPGAGKTPMSGTAGFRRARQVRGWVVRPVERDEELPSRRYEPGLVITVEGRFHRLDNEVRGWGQRDFPQYHHTVDPDPLELPVEERLIGELDALRRQLAPE